MKTLERIEYYMFFILICILIPALLIFTITISILLWLYYENSAIVCMNISVVLAFLIALWYLFSGLVIPLIRKIHARRLVKSALKERSL